MELSLEKIACVQYNAAHATVAQQAEQSLRKRRVKGSIPFGGSNVLISALIVLQQDAEKCRLDNAC